MIFLQAKRMLLAGCSIFLLLNPCLYGQNDMYSEQGNILTNIIPPSPEVASLGTYGDAPANTYIGAISQSIPLLELSAGAIDVPVALNYTSNGGIKVAEIANNCGLGWSLSTNAVVSRQMYGRADDQNGFLETPLNYSLSDLDPPPAGSSSGAYQSHLQFLYDIAKGCIDFQTDIYHYTFGGYSGKFYFDWNGQMIHLGPSPVKITYTLEPTSGAFKTWEITTETGIKYIFSAPERSIAVKPLYLFHPVLCNDFQQDYNSAWHLSRIEDGYGNYVDYSYEMYAYRKTMPTAHQVNVIASISIGPYTRCEPEHNAAASYHTPGLMNNGVASTSYYMIHYFQKRIKTITTSNGEQVVFNYQTNRTDTTSLFDIDNFKKLDNINFYNNDQLIRSWNLVHDYSTNRLTLRTLEEKDNTGSIEKSYKFKYHGNIPKDIHSFAIDHWGYYNGSSNNENLVPTFYSRVFHDGGNIIDLYYDGANREVNPAFSAAGLLHEIEYPTGGRVQYEYENHETGTIASMPGALNIVPVSSLGFHPYTTVTVTGYADANASGQRIISRDTFQVLDTAVLATLFFNASIGSNQTCFPMDKPKMVLSKIDGGTTVIAQRQFNYTNPGDQDEGGYSDQQMIFLQPGTYEIRTEAECNESGMDNATLTVRFDQPDMSVILTKIPVGGARIKKIVTQDIYGGEPTVREFKYGYAGNADSSSGVIYTLPKYKDDQIMIEEISTCAIVYGLESHVAQNPVQTLFTGGSHIGYEWVEVQTSGMGKKTFRYTSPAMYSDYISHYYPYLPPNFSSNYKTGLLLEECQYNTSNALIRKINRTYDFNDTAVRSDFVFYKGSPGYVLGTVFYNASFTTTYSVIRSEFFDFDYYYLTTGYPRLKSEMVTDYFSSPVTSTKTFTYHPSVPQLRRSESSTNSDGKVYKTNYAYPADQTSSSVRTTMINKNMVALPVSTKDYVNASLVHTLQNTYALYNGTNVHLQKTATATGTNPLVDEVIYHHYDERGNPLDYTTRSGDSVCILWGYGETYPVCVIKKVSRAAVVAFLNANLSVKATLENPASEAALRNAIQQIRNHFSQSMVTGYTYRPSVGVSSTIDPNNTTTYYEYDASGKLSIVKDQYGNILEHHVYQFQGPQ